MYFSIRYTVPEDSAMDNKQYRRKKMSACVRSGNVEHLKKLVQDYCDSIKRTYYDVEFFGVFPVGDASFNVVLSKDGQVQGI